MFRHARSSYFDFLNDFYLKTFLFVEAMLGKLIYLTTKIIKCSVFAKINFAKFWKIDPSSSDIPQKEISRNHSSAKISFANNLYIPLR